MVKGTFRGKFPRKIAIFFEETSYEIAKILGGFGQFFFFWKSPYLGNGFLWFLNM
jgi:hypothetical protein